MKLSITKKLTLLIASTTVLMLILMSAAFVLIDTHLFRKQLVQQTAERTKIIGLNNAAALMFTDVDSAQENLDVLSVDPNVVQAALYTPDGKLFVHYPADRPVETQLGAEMSQDDESYFMKGHLHEKQTIEYNGNSVGTILLELRMGALENRLKHFALFAVVVFFLSVILTVAFSSRFHRFISNRILILSQITQDVSSSRDYSVRVPDLGEDELGVLATGFNQMLEQIQIQEDGLKSEINERQEAEVALRKSEENLKITLDSIGDAVITVDQNEQVSGLNPAAEKLTGWTVQEAVGHSILKTVSLINEETRLPVEFSLANESDEPLGEPGRTLLIRKNGDERRVADSCSRIQDKKGNLLGVVLVFRDITEQYQMESQMRQSQKMQAIGQLSGGIAHDFNNLLTGIMGSAELLELRLDADSPLHAFVKIILESSERAADLNAKLLAFSRKGMIENQVVDLHQIINAVVDILSQTLDRRITIERNFLDTPVRTSGEPSMLQNALLNLAINARDAMPKGGTLTFSTTKLNLDREYCDQNGLDINPGSYAEVSVSDTGTGMDDKIMKKIFEPFFTTKGVGEGTGLGLSAAYGTLKKHHGTIHVYSELGMGTVFKLYLPLNETDELNLPVQEKVVRGKGNILLADDEEVIRIMAREHLCELGYTVTVAENGKVAVDHFKEHWREIDLVILDMVMPEMNGRDAFFEMKKIDPNVRVLVASGFNLNIKSDDLFSEGVNAFLQKPYRVAELSRIIAETINLKHPEAPAT